MSAIRDNWRVITLSILVVLSGVALFVPGATLSSAGGENATGVTNLQYGIQLDGGARIRAPVVGLTAENVNLTAGETTSVESQVADALGVDGIDVRASAETSTVEVYSANVTAEELASALQDAGYSVQADDVREGVTQATRDNMVEVIESKIDESGLSGGSARSVTTATGDHFIVVEAPNRDRQQLRNLLSDRGVVRVFAFYPQNGSYARDQVLTQEDFSRIGNAQNLQGQGPGVQVTVEEDAARQFAQSMVDRGFGNGAQCRYNREAPNESSGRCLVTTLDGEVVFAGGVRPDLGQSFRDGSFARDPTFVMTTRSLSEARELEISLKAGRLPAPLNFEQAQTSFLEPALAERFKSNSLITGIVAVLAVSLTVYFRYGDARVAAPMVVTALSEVFLLLGFAAAVQYPLDLSVIAGFIAVIGTGVDDLIIIADEVMSEGKVDSSRIFQNRFRKAFWVIGAAAATTIIAMSPLAVLSLGDLRGFAIITILGVIIGVLITRPAYGDILRKLLTIR